ncbi:helix-turn-helix domain-containing protein [Gluconobacter sp. LMG 1744]|uniref:Transposase n=1 Tax=Gluconobacter kondonii TaxID=941463 RepID=A0ABQ5WUU5_9PROT|nr:helix-turn-helix domain-containing protein [Gluconobacter cadivus]MBS1053872.1 helix-turn-helix domain-containing protein [Gluconobacter kondonii]MBS1075877.1 helix-turn-helix domain-containing protein [Gluconobacter sp. Dm-73]MBS1087221.1 helix-turn-helix domain-containing protein [Gluconobacter sphaericus]MBS1092486.1 helix-turn-helix domain-containing protein [Gluconobacter sp. Dm-74]
MARAIALRTDYTADALRWLAARTRDANVARRLLSLAAVREGSSRGEAARIGGMDRQTLRDWVLRFNAAGPAGLRYQWCNASVCRLTADQQAELSALIVAGPDRNRGCVVRWRSIDLKRVIEKRFGVSYHNRQRYPQNWSAMAH